MELEIYGLNGVIKREATSENHKSPIRFFDQQRLKSLTEMLDKSIILDLVLRYSDFINLSKKPYIIRDYYELLDDEFSKITLYYVRSINYNKARFHGLR